jgi:hypothetical protein
MVCAAAVGVTAAFVGSLKCFPLPPFVAAPAATALPAIIVLATFFLATSALDSSLLLLTLSPGGFCPSALKAVRGPPIRRGSLREGLTLKEEAFKQGSPSSDLTRKTSAEEACKKGSPSKRKPSSRAHPQLIPLARDAPSQLPLSRGQPPGWSSYSVLALRPLRATVRQQLMPACPSASPGAAAWAKSGTCLSLSPTPDCCGA